MNYDVDYFIRKFKRIPDTAIGSGDLDSHCALWHCGMRSYAVPHDESTALIKLFGGRDWMDADKVYFVNDLSGARSMPFWKAMFSSPKRRILSKLYDIKAKQDIDTGNKVEQPKTIYRTVVIDSPVKELTEKELSLQ